MTDDGSSNSSFTVGVFVNTSASNVTLQNCPGISNYTNGVYVLGSGNNVLNVTANNNTQNGMLFVESSGNNIANDSAYGNGNVGFNIFVSNGNNLSSDTSYQNLEGIQLQSSSGNILSNDTSFQNQEGIQLQSSSGNILSNDTVSNNRQPGFVLSSSSNNLLINDVGHDDINAEFLVAGGSNNNLTNDTGYSENNAVYELNGENGDNINNCTADNAPDGFFAINSANLVMNADSAFDNGYSGFELRGITNSNLTAMHYYNNSVSDMAIDSGSNNNYNPINNIFDNPSGDYQNFTNLTISDTTSGESYLVHWSSSPAAPPGGEQSFAQKFVNISTQSGSPVIDSVTWSWSPSEIGPNDSESAFALYEYNSSGWFVLNNTPDTNLHTLSFFNLTPHSVYGILQAVTTTPPPSGGGPSTPPLNVGFSSSCISSSPSNTVTVTSGNAVSGATVVVNGNILGVTDGSGQASFSGCGQNVSLYARKDGYTPSGNVQGIEMACNQCLQLLNNTNATKPPPPLPPSQCTSPNCCTNSSQCLDYQACLTPTGAPANQINPGSCINITGMCGYATNHTWISYQCDSSPECACPLSQQCIDHICVSANVTCPSTEFINTIQTCSVSLSNSSCANLSITEKDPNGAITTATTDSNCNFQFNPQTHGNYTFTLLSTSGGALAATTSLAITPAPITPPAPKPVVTTSDYSWLIWLLILLAVIIIGLIYWRRRNGKKRSK